MWKKTFYVVDLLCCGGILFPVIWSVVLTLPFVGHKFKFATISYHALSTLYSTYLVKLRHFSYIHRTLRSSKCKQLSVLKTTLRIAKCAFSVGVRNWFKSILQLNHLKLWPPFIKNHRTCMFEIAFPHQLLSAVPHPKDNLCLSLFMIVPLSLNFQTYRGNRNVTITSTITGQNYLSVVFKLSDIQISQVLSMCLCPLFNSRRSHQITIISTLIWLWPIEPLIKIIYDFFKCNITLLINSVIVKFN